MNRWQIHDRYAAVKPDDRSYCGYCKAMRWFRWARTYWFCRTCLRSLQS